MLKSSRMLALGTRAPVFSLPDPAGTLFSLDDIAAGRPILVAFLSNHCPYVRHLAAAFAQFARDYQARGLAVVAICSNDAIAYPEDAPPRMAQFAAQFRFSFPYLYDESQRVALDYQAVCTPDFFLFDRHLKLAYRGQFDASRPGNKHVANDGADMRAAADSVLAGGVPDRQVASAGCSIKWKPANEPDWA